MTFLANMQPGVGTPARALLAAPMQLQATTDTPGVPLINGTPNLLVWNVPADGQQHPFMFVGARTVTSTETGGAISILSTPPNGVQISTSIAGGGSAAGTASLSNPNCFGIAASGSQVIIQQTSALTGGACVVNGAIYGA